MQRQERPADSRASSGDLHVDERGGVDHLADDRELQVPRVRGVVLRRRAPKQQHLSMGRRDERKGITLHLTRSIIFERCRTLVFIPPRVRPLHC